MIFLWENPRSSQLIKYAFVLENHLVFWHADGQDKIGFIENNDLNIDLLFDILKENVTLDNNNIEKIKSEKDYDPNTMTENQKFQKSLFNNSLGLKDYFIFNNKSFCIYYNQKRIVQ